jgi:cytochrome c oxidase subunit 2
MLQTLNILADVGGNFWQPPSASTIAPEVDWLFYAIFWVCVFFTLLITALLVVFAWKYRYREDYIPGEAPKHNTALELTWTFVPTVILTIIFVYGFQGFLHMAVPPPDPYEIVVQAHMWAYNFYYPNQHLDDKLHVPAGVPIMMVLNSSDVIHGFYIPAFRVKKDDVPGRDNKIWFEAKLDPGQTQAEYDIFCTQYCGQGHSTMRSKVIVQSMDDFKKWLASASIFKGSPEEHGKYLWETRGCNSCHSIDGTTNRCPTWKDVFGSTVTFQDGTSQVADESYLRYVIDHPNSKPIPGFDKIMPPTIDAGLVTENDVTDIIAFVKTLSKNYHPSKALGTEPATTQTTAPAN